MTLLNVLSCELRSLQQSKCPACGSSAIIKSMHDSSSESQTARGPSCSMNLKPACLSGVHEVSCVDFDRIRQRGDPHVLLDVRVTEQFDLCALPGAINIPVTSVPQRLGEISELSGGTKPVYCICRRGIASADATNIILQAAHNFPYIHSVKNIKGGLDAWRMQVNNSFPKY
mmetsp:Transcript_3325/g.6052  ORF Transcript_3325/g.6052 Transcript_3325/m.6052 type:complete len:172 (+) Transcript_3325:115-630(+)